MNTPQVAIVAFGFVAVAAAAMAQNAAAAAAGGHAAATGAWHARHDGTCPRPRGARPPAPTRDPHTPGYVDAKELPDGAVPPLDDEGNFIIGPTHNPAPEMTVQEGVPHGTVHNFTMKSTDSKIYPGIAREPRHAEPAGPEQSGEADREQPARALHAPRGGVCPAAICAGHGRAIHRRRGRSGSDVVHGAGQSDRAETRAGDDRHLDRQRQRRCAGQSARPGIRHDVGSVCGVRRNRSAAAGRKAVQRAD